MANTDIPTHSAAQLISDLAARATDADLAHAGKETGLPTIEGEPEMKSPA